MILSIVSLVVAVIALAVNTSNLLRRPRIVAEWGYVQDSPPYEGLAMVVTARRRPLEVDEVGLVMLADSTRRLQVPEWIHQERPYRYRLGAGDLPKRLEDGQSLRAFGELDSLIDDLQDVPGKAYPYVQASGTVYLGRDSKWLRRLRRRLGED